MSILKVIVVGGGRAGAELHVPAFLACPEVNVVGICDPDLGRAQAASQRLGLRDAYVSLEAALQAQQVDVVSVCTPPQTHLQLARQSMEAGCDVLLEKPMTVTLDETEQLLAVRARTGKRLCVVHQNKYTPGVTEMRRIVERGDPGDVLQLDMTWLSNGDQDRMVVDPHFWCHSIPGGRFAESLPHLLYVAYSLVGPMRLRHVAARKRTLKWPWMIVDEVNVILESRDGYVNIRMSANPAEMKRSLNILHGTRQSYLFSYKMAMPVSQHPASDRQRVLGALSVARDRAFRLVPTWRGNRATDDLGPHRPVIQQFVRHVLYGEPPPTSLEEAHHVMQLTHEYGAEFERQMGATLCQ